MHLMSLLPNYQVDNWYVKCERSTEHSTQANNIVESRFALHWLELSGVHHSFSSFNGAVLLISHDRFLVRSVIEGKRDTEHKLDEDFEGLEEEETQETPRRRSVYVIKQGKMNEQKNGVEQFEKSLVKRVQKLLPSID